MAVSVSGESRESVAFAIVMQLAVAEGKLKAGGAASAPSFDRQWLFDAFTFAWRCLENRT
jgi:hypothetical protein